ncbi:MAG TPA: hypothetical protein DCR12_04500 [Lachnospiraceae bacterium]|nr:hypothetical protein [Lachnospiraceae bacterium]
MIINVGYYIIFDGVITMSSYNEYKNQMLKNEEVKTEYDALQQEFDNIQEIINKGYVNDKETKEHHTRTNK